MGFWIYVIMTLVVPVEDESLDGEINKAHLHFEVRFLFLENKYPYYVLSRSTLR
jgi:hypothetical protein